MSMMGMFREIPPPLVARLKADPSLAEEIVRGESPLPIPNPDVFQGVKEKLPGLLEQNREQLLNQLAPEQRRFLENLPPEQKEQFFQRLSEQLTSHVLSSLRRPSGPGAPQAALSGRDLGELLDLDKAWHGVHFLLTGNTEQATPGAGQAVLGGKDVGDDLGYGPARLLSPEEVATVSGALSVMTEQTLRDRFDPAAMDEADVYPGGWSEEPENLKWLLDAVGDLRKFYAGAAARGSGVLLYIT